MASDVPKDPGGPLELHVRDHLASALPALQPARDWIAACGQIITKFDQYAHLSEVYELVRGHPELAAGRFLRRSASTLAEGTYEIAKRRRRYGSSA